MGFHCNKHFIVTALLALCTQAAEAQTTLSFQPDTINLAQGQSALVFIEVGGLPAGGVAAAQLRIDLDNTVATIEDPNAAFVPTVLPFTPLGSDPLCDSVRGAPCSDPAWLLTSTGRTPVLGIAETGASGEHALFAFGTHGAAALPQTDGAIAIIRIVAQADGQTTATLTQSLLADAAQIPAAIPLTSGTLSVTVGGAPDSDGDGVPDTTDNCLDIINPSQIDTDADNFGNACDPDYNNDGVVNVIDLGLLKLAFFGNDANIDLNGDGIVNVIDLGILKSFFFQPPGPSGTAARPAAPDAAAPDAAAPGGDYLNSAPVIIAPAALVVSSEEPMTLDASASHDDDLDRLEFSWTMLSAPSDAPGEWRSANPRATLTLSAPGDYEFEVAVSDGIDTQRQHTTVTVTQSGQPTGAAVDAGTPRTARLYVSGKRAGAIVPAAPEDSPSYHWSVVSAPASSELTTRDLEGRLGRHVSFSPDGTGQYVLRLDVADADTQRFEQHLIEVSESE